jgi:CHAD domain-containing protein
MGIGELAFAVLRRQFLALLANEPGTRLGDDPEKLHDMRVAIRRLRAALRLFEPYLPARAGRLRVELKEVGRVLGAVRDLDVQTAELAAFAGRLGEEGRAAEPLLARLHAIRAKRRAAMLKALDAPRTRRLLEATQAMLRRSPPAYTRADRLPAVVVVPSLIRKRYRSFRKAADRIDGRAPAAAYHEVRIRGKRLRYAIEFAEGLYGGSGDPAVRSLVRLQDLLGAHQDAHVVVEQLRATALQGDKRLPADTVFLMGRMAESAERAARRIRREFPRACRRLRGKRWHRYCRAQERALLGSLPFAGRATAFEPPPSIDPNREGSQEP